MKWMMKIKMVWEKVCPFLSAVLNVNTMSVIIAAIAAFFSYKALNESIRQRESMYKPELFMGSVNFYADCRNSKDIKFYRIEQDTMIKEDLRPWYKLCNVGMGTALSVYGAMKFNSGTLFSYFSENNLDDVKSINEVGFVDTLIHKQDTITVFREGTISDWKVDYVVPLGQQQVEFKQYFPPSVLNDMIKAFLWVVNEKDETSISDFHIPIDLGYKDINGKLYKKSFEITINFSLVENNKDWIFCFIYVGSSSEDYIRELYDMRDEMKSL